MTKFIDNMNYYFSVNTTLVDGRIMPVTSKKSGAKIKEYLSNNPSVTDWRAIPIKEEI